MALFKGQPSADANGRLLLQANTNGDAKPARDVADLIDPEWDLRRSIGPFNEMFYEPLNITDVSGHEITDPREFEDAVRWARCGLWTDKGLGN